MSWSFIFKSRMDFSFFFSCETSFSTFSRLKIKLASRCFGLKHYFRLIFAPFDIKPVTGVCESEIWWFISLCMTFVENYSSQISSFAEFFDIPGNMKLKNFFAFATDTRAANKNCDFLFLPVKLWKARHSKRNTNLNLNFMNLFSAERVC